MNTNDKGNHAELRVAARLKSLGYTVLTPFAEETKYDIVVDTDDGFVKMQVKSSNLKDGRVVFNCHSTPWVDASEATQYTADEIDGFAVFNNSRDECYWVPLEDANDYTMTLNPDDDSKHPTCDYLLENNFS
jgi:hypothetical protein